MAYDVELAERVRDLLAEVPGVSEKRMFGGLAFLVDDHLAVAASGQGGLLARVDPSDADDLLADDGVEPMVMRGRPMAGWLFVTLDAVATDDALAAWVGRALAFVRTLPPKDAVGPRRIRARGARPPARPRG